VDTAANGRTLALSNLHGDLSGVFAAAGTSLAGSTTYDPWGQVLATAGPAIELGYQGQWTDPATQQVDMGSRFYRPRTGGFDNQDTYTGGEGGAAVTDNSYAYADDNPMSITDPTGHSPSSKGGTGPVTEADVKAAAGRVAQAKQRAAKAEAAAQSARNLASAADRAASADATQARSLNGEAAKLLGEYNSVNAQAKAAYAKSKAEAATAQADRADAESLQSQLYQTVPNMVPELVRVGATSSTTTMHCGVGAVTGGGILTGTCTLTTTSGNPGTWATVMVQHGTKES
jgi:RHS repeat-associated protein